MKFARTFSVSACAISAILVVAACASNDEVGDAPAQAAASTQPPESKLPPPSNNPPADKPPEKKCASSCKTDKDCEDSCPGAGSGASNCCDTATSQCYKSASNVCPAPKTDTDSGAPPY